MNLQEVFNKYKGTPQTMIDGMHAEWGGDKGSTHSYIGAYEALLDHFRDKSINLLEIGVMYGSSVKMWKEYFQKGNIYGIDIRPHVLKYNEDRIKIDLVNATKQDEIDKYLKDKNLKFDIIIDDGSHQIQDQLNTVGLLYPYLNEGGIYIIEDIQAIDSQKQYFEQLGVPIEIIDLRSVKGRHDDVLIIIRK